MKKNGYTLIELLVTITIVLVLGTLGFVSYGYASANVRDAKRKSDLEGLRSALEMYRSDNGYYSEGPLMSDTGFKAISNATTFISDTYMGSYVSVFPEDPKYDATAYPYPYQVVMTERTAAPLPEHNYGYCLAARLETVEMGAGKSLDPGEGLNKCTVALPLEYNYGVKNP